MKYWIENIAEPFTREQIHEQRHRLTPTTRCAPLGVNEWRPICEVIPDLFTAEFVPPEPAVMAASAKPWPVFCRESVWPIVFYSLAALCVVIGIIIGYRADRLVGFLVALSGCLGCVFCAVVCRLLIDIRWLLSKRVPAPSVGA